MKIPRLMTVYKLRIVYRSGYTHDFEATQFEIRGGTYRWDVPRAACGPLLIGVDDIAAVWRLGESRRLVWK